MLTSLAYIFLLGLVLGSIANKLKLPRLLGMILTGMVLGPYAWNLLDESILMISADLRQLALVIILTRAGLALNLSELKKVGRPAILMCFVPAIFEITAVVVIAPRLLGVTTLEAVIMGTVVAAVSPAVIVPRMIQLIEEKRGTKHSIPQLIMASASVDDIFVIVLFTSFTSIATGEAFSWSTFLEIPMAIVTGVALGIVVGLICILLFQRVHMRDSTKVILLLSASFLMIALEKSLAGRISMSGLLGIMSMGATLLYGKPNVARRVSDKFSKLWVGAELLLFVLVGATVDIRYAMSSGILVIILILCSIVFRMLAVLLCLLGTQLTWKERAFCMIAYCPKATVQAAIGSIPLTMGLSCGPMVLTVAVLSILITAPLGALGIDLTYKKLLS